MWAEDRCNPSVVWRDCVRASLRTDFGTSVSTRREMGQIVPMTHVKTTCLLLPQLDDIMLHIV